MQTEWTSPLILLDKKVNSNFGYIKKALHTVQWGFADKFCEDKKLFKFTFPVSFSRDEYLSIQVFATDMLGESIVTALPPSGESAYFDRPCKVLVLIFHHL